MGAALEDAIKDAVQAGLDEYLQRYTRRLVDPECLTYTFPQAGKVIGTSEHTVRRLVNDGHLPIVPHMGDRRLIPRVAVERFVNAPEVERVAALRGVA